MDYEPVIDCYLDCKNLAKKSIRSQKSVIRAFLSWRGDRKTKKLLDDSFEYARYLQTNRLYKENVRRKRIQLVTSFCEFAD